MLSISSLLCPPKTDMPRREKTPFAFLVRAVASASGQIVFGFFLKKSPMGGLRSPRPVPIGGHVLATGIVVMREDDHLPELIKNIKAFGSVRDVRIEGLL
jgi:hypothetical protein